MRSGCSLKRHWLCQVTLSLRRAIACNANSKQCKHWAWLHSALGDPHRFCQPCTTRTEIVHWAQSPKPYFAKRNNVLNLHLVLWRVSRSTLLSLSSPTHNWGVVTGKRVSEKCSKSKSQENPTDFQCVLCCIGTQSCWEKRIYAADLGTSYNNSLKMPFKVHAKNEAFCCNKSSYKWGISRTSGRALVAHKEHKNT